ncbi:putative immunity protein [Mycolicibacterium hodleri]|uniref:putative immunity protein n=1 Tax=Mycolicibacterium hodleri TaxID=49897 RepID=UPI0031841D13
MTKSPTRGPKPDPATHKALARWAATCAERTLPIFEECRPGDNRPRTAIESLRAWVQGDFSMIACRTAAFAAHAAARDAAQAGALAAVAAARAAGQAAAVAHMSDHSAHSAMYAAKAVGLDGSGEPTRNAERLWQWENLESTLRPIGFPKGL